MTLEALMALGITEAQAQGALKLHNDAINGFYVPKATFEAERISVQTLKTQVEDRDRQINELGAFKGTAEALTAKVTQLEAKNKADAEKAASDMAALIQDNAIRSQISSVVHDPEDVVSRLDKTKIVFEDGKVKSGLNEQLEDLKKTKPHYFKEQSSGTGGYPGGWKPFGKTPADSADDKGQGNPAANFGAELAKQKADGEKLAAKAADTYFK
jgi:hypothetical protein